jgi:peptide/nickel transport system permease protein
VAQEDLMRYLYRRVLFYVVALWASLTINFFLPRLMPGDPVGAFVSRFRDVIANNPHILDAIRIELGASKDPLWKQYFEYLGNIVHGNFGVSYSQYPSRVSDIIATTLPWTIVLAGTATVLAFLIGTFLGIVAAWRRGGIVDRVVTPLTMFTYSFPAFFVAMLVLYFLGVQAGWFPLNHAYGDNTQISWNFTFIKSAVDHAVLPVLAFLLVSIGGWLLGMRNVMINTLSEEYVTMAQAKGLSDRRVMLRYAARNAMLPQITSFAITVGYIITGLVLIEDVFAYPGVGYTLVQAVQSNDYPLMQALFLLITLAVLGANFVADLLYIRLDPRVRAR